MDSSSITYLEINGQDITDCLKVEHLTPIEQAQSAAITEALRTLAPPEHAVTRIWGRLEGATPEQAQDGNAWAADPEDIAELAVLALRKVRCGQGGRHG